MRQIEGDVARDAARPGRQEIDNGDEHSTMYGPFH
jgi:hypothetical protein